MATRHSHVMGDDNEKGTINLALLREVLELAKGEGGFDVRDRDYHLKKYSDCFIASEAVTWVVENVPQVDGDRHVATSLLQKLVNLKGIRLSRSINAYNTLQSLVAIRHVVDYNKPILDGYLFFRFNSDTVDIIMDFFATVAEFEKWALQSFKNGVGAQDVTVNGTLQRNVFNGKQAFEFTKKTLVKLSNGTHATDEEVENILQLSMELALFDPLEKHISEFRLKFQDSDMHFTVGGGSLFNAACLQFSTQSKSIGIAARKLGWTPQYPAIIVPGFASSALEAWDIDNSSWFHSRVWVDPGKIGVASSMQRMKDKMGKRMSSTGETEGRRWLNTVIPAPDGYSDPTDAVKIRAVKGLHGIDYLATSPLVKNSSYVFGPLIKNLIQSGYENKNLQAATYDWRLPPCKLEERDGYFSELKYMILSMHEINQQKVVLLGHSMGNRIISYFLNWIHAKDDQFIKSHIHAWMALGAPFLGAPKAARSILTGDSMGLDFFLRQTEAVTLARRCGSTPLLLPVRHDLYPDHLCRTREDKKSSFSPTPILDLIETVSKDTAKYMGSYYLNDPYAFGSGSLNQSVDVLQDSGENLPLLKCPQVDNLWLIYGTDVPTEVSYFYRKSKKNEIMPWQLDIHADKHSYKQCPKMNPRALKISGGRAMETETTYQPITEKHISGDGTVPYASLAYPLLWSKNGESNGCNIIAKEMKGERHREMLKSKSVILAVLEYLCGQNV